MVAEVTWLAEAWNFLCGWGGISIAIGVVATAIAILEPKQLDLITDLRKWAITVAVIAFSSTGLIAHGYKNGIAVKQAEWNKALAAEAVNGEKDRAAAVAAVGSDDPDRSVFQNDPFNRDAGQQPTKPAGPVRWPSAHHLFGK